MIRILITALVAMTSFVSPMAMANTVSTEPRTPAVSDSMKFKVPSSLGSSMVIPADIKAFLDQDFYSRYPVTSPVRTDVRFAEVDAYSTFRVHDGDGGFDKRHAFRVLVNHPGRVEVTVDITIYQRSSYEPGQDPILIETFRVVGWTRY